MRRERNRREQQDQNKDPKRQKDWLVHGAKLTGFSAMVNPVTPRRSELTEPENFV